MKSLYRLSNKLLIISLILVNCSNHIDDDEIVLTINNEPVTKAEYLFIMSSLKPEVYSSFAQNLDGPEFWNGNFNGEVPGKVLHQKTVQSLRRIKTEQSLMKVYGIADDITFNGFITSLNKENARRKTAIEKKIPVYGPVEFDERTYFQYLHSERVQKLKKSIHIESSIKQDDLNRMYDEVRRTDDSANVNTEELKTYLMMQLLNNKYNAMIDTLEMNSKLVFKIKDKDFKELQGFLF